MKKSIKLGALLLGAAALLPLASCSSKQADNAESIPDTPVFVSTDNTTLDAPELKIDSLLAIFNNPQLKAETATDSTYAQTTSGLKYLILRKGQGEAPTATDVVKVHYLGMLTDGSVFDSSYDRGEPATFPLNRVIPGWTEGLQLMQTGGMAVFYIPSAIGYGPQGMPPVIPADADLIFAVELLAVEK